VTLVCISEITWTPRWAVYCFSSSRVIPFPACSKSLMALTVSVSRKLSSSARCYVLLHNWNAHGVMAMGIQ
jgi:hypothetical protein